ncbi:hypothetical protein [Paracidovorax sp. MALMAid1276]|uniref:hypothetical protein n=1 Tax=Paracidovorax sp. MALMAid1276 TaxID=3411631 RepID=UPI003B993005
MPTDPNEHPAHKVPEQFPLPPGDLPPGDLPPSTDKPTLPPQPSLPPASQGGPYAGEKEDEAGDPVGKSPRM